LTSAFSFLIFHYSGVSFYKGATLESGVEYHSGDCVVLDSAAARGSDPDSAADCLRSIPSSSPVKIIRCFVQEGDLPIYVLVEDVFGRNELAARAIRCGTPSLAGHIGSR
jgi:hypothetical protein